MNKVVSTAIILCCASLVFMLSRCATTSNIQNGILSSDDSLRSEAYYAFERKLNADKQLNIISKFVEIAKYGKSDESLKAFNFLAKSEYSHILAGNYCYGTETYLSNTCNKLKEELRVLDSSSIGRYLNSIDNGPYETQIFCIEVLGNARPIYVSAVKKLIHLLNTTTSETADDENRSTISNRNMMWPAEPVNYYAYWALKRIKTIEALEAAAKYDSVFTRN